MYQHVHPILLLLYTLKHSMQNTPHSYLTIEAYKEGKSYDITGNKCSFLSYNN